MLFPVFLDNLYYVFRYSDFVYFSLNLSVVFFKRQQCFIASCCRGKDEAEKSGMDNRWVAFHQAAFSLPFICLSTTCSCPGTLKMPLLGSLTDNAPQPQALWTKTSSMWVILLSIAWNCSLLKAFFPFKKPPCSKNLKYFKNYIFIFNYTSLIGQF